MSVLKSILNTDNSRLSVSSRRPEDMKNARCTQNEVVVHKTKSVLTLLRIENYLFSLFCMKNYFLCERRHRHVLLSWILKP